MRDLTLTPQMGPDGGIQRWCYVSTRQASHPGSDGGCCQSQDKKREVDEPCRERSVVARAKSKRLEDPQPPEAICSPMPQLLNRCTNRKYSEQKKSEAKMLKSHCDPDHPRAHAHEPRAPTRRLRKSSHLRW